MSKLADEIFEFLKLGGSFSVAEKCYLKCTLITKKTHTFRCVSFFAVEKDRFEDLNAARMSAAREGSTERYHNFSSHREENCKQIWPVPDTLTDI